MQVADAGLPVVLVVTERFESLGRSILKSKGRGDIPVYVLPSDIETRSDAELCQLAAQTLPELIDLLKLSHARLATGEVLNANG